MGFEGTRDDGRVAPNKVRAIHVVTNVLANCHSSSCVEIGKTRVLCGVRPPQQLVQEYRGTRGRVSCQVHHTHTASSEVDGAVERDMALALEGVMEQIVLLETIPQLLIEVLIEVINDDGAVWDAAATAMSAALAAGGIEMHDTFSCCTAGLTREGAVAVDLTKEEEREAVARVVVCSSLTLGGVLYCSHQGSCDAATVAQLATAAIEGSLVRKDFLLEQLRRPTKAV